MGAEGRIEYSMLRLQCAFAVQSILGFKIQEEAGEHGKGVFRVRLEGGGDLAELLAGMQDTRVELAATGETGEAGVETVPLFSCCLEEARLSEEGGYCEAEITALSGTALLDRKKNSRIFQKPGQKYGDVAERVARDTAGGACILTVQDREAGTPFFQYRETDWEFMKRVAGRIGLPLVADTGCHNPRFYMGLRRGRVQEVPEGSNTGCRFDGERYYRLLGQGADVERKDFFCYQISTWKRLELGERVVLEGRELSVFRKETVLCDGQVGFSYECAGPGYSSAPPQRNRDMTGLELLGTVTAQEKENCELALDVEPSQTGGFPYPYAPSVGNLMYCMPEKDTKVRLKLGSGEEAGGMVCGCLRTNGSECVGTAVPAMRGFQTDYGKGMEVHPESVGVTGGTVGSLRIEDAGGVSLTSSTGMCLYAKGSIILDSGKAIDIQTVAEICAESLLSATSTLWMNNRFDYLSTGTLLKGSIYRVGEPFDDAPREGKFDWKGFARNLVAGLVLGVAFVALSVVTGGLAGAVLMGAGVSVLMTTASMSISDYESGNVRSWEEAQLELTVAAICGAITGAVAFWAQGAFEGVKFLMSHPVVRKALVETISGTVDVVTGLMMRASEVGMDKEMTREEKLAYIFDWGAIGFDFFTGMVIDLGVGGLKWLGGGRAVKETAQEAAERAAKEAAEEAAERAAKEAAEEAAERAAKEAAEEAAERAAKEAAEEAAERAAKEAAEEAAERAAKEAAEEATERVARESIEEGAEQAAKSSADAKRIDEIKVEFNYNSKHDEGEFARQLADQQKGMNELTVQEFLDNRDKFLEQGRAIEGNAAQQAARDKALTDKIDELLNAGLSLEEAEAQAQKWLDTRAALHNPDQIAGGYASNIGGVGDKGVNSSIGSQWRYRIDDVDEQIRQIAESMTEAEKKSTYLNVNLIYKGE